MENRNIKEREMVEHGWYEEKGGKIVGSFKWGERKGRERGPITDTKF